MDHDRSYAPSRYAGPPDSSSDGSSRRSWRKLLILGMLVALMMATIAGTAYLEVRLGQDEGSVRRIRSVPVAIPTATPDLSLPTNNGWTPVAPTGYGNIQFAGAIQSVDICVVAAAIMLHTSLGSRRIAARPGASASHQPVI